MTKTNTMNAVIYARFSSSKQQEQSIDGQIRACTEYAEKCGYNILTAYIDKAISGTSDNRPEFQRMIADSKKKVFDIVLVWKFDRFARNRFDSAIYKQKLRENGVRVISITEDVGDTIDGNLIEAIYEAMAENYSRQLSQNVIRGMRESAIQGNSVGGMVPFGYKIENKKYVIDEKAAPIVRHIFDEYASGKRKSEIISELNAKGYRNSKGKPFTIQSLSKMFTNQRYIGVYKYCDIIIEDGYPAIVSKDVFERCAKRAQLNKRISGHANQKVEYLLTGKAFCGYCGNPIVSGSGTGRNGKHYYYVCTGKARKLKGAENCNKKTEIKELLERYIAECAIRYFSDPQIVTRTAEQIAQTFRQEAPTEGKISELEKRLKETDIELERLVDSLLSAKSAAFLAKINERAEQLELQKNDINDELITLRLNAKVSTTTADEIAEWLLRFCDGDIDDSKFRADIIDKLVSKVFIFDDKLVIYYKIKDCEEVSYSEMLEDIMSSEGERVSEINSSGRPRWQSNL